MGNAALIGLVASCSAFVGYVVGKRVAWMRCYEQTMLRQWEQEDD